jgi:hypothetical protein
LKFNDAPQSKVIGKRLCPSGPHSVILKWSRKHCV